MPTFQILQGHWLDQAKKLADNSVHMAVCSPPYWGLRNYKTEPQIWGNEHKCEHEWATYKSNGQSGGNSPKVAIKGVENFQAFKGATCATCATCGAWKGELGQEPTPALFIEHLVAIFREVRRVLRPDGTLWINIGDSYATGAGSAKSAGGKNFGKSNMLIDAGLYPRSQVNRNKIDGLKTGDLVGIPWALAMALRTDGWYLRRDNIWHKQSCMPESVMGWRWEKCKIKVKGHERGTTDWSNSTELRPQSDSRHTGPYEDAQWKDCPSCHKCEKNDGLVLRKGSGRCTTSHEYVFHFSKSENYYYDSEAVAEKSGGQNGAAASFARETKDHVIPNQSAAQHRLDRPATFDTGTRNKRSVWTLAPEPYSEDHFAAYPSELPTICIKAGTSEHGCCADCGSPYARVVRTKAMVINRYRNEKTGNRTGASGTMVEPAERETLGWRKTCNCETKATAPPIVLDPFGGRGTTGAAAARLGRDVILCELQPEYVPMIRKNIKAEAPLFVTEKI